MDHNKLDNYKINENVLIRISPIPFNSFRKMENENLKRSIEKYINLEKEYKDFTQYTCHLIFEEIKNSENDLNLLIKLKRNIYNERKIEFLDTLFLKNKEIILVVKKLQVLYNIKYNLRQSIEKEYFSNIYMCRIVFQKLLQDSHLTNGVLISTPIIKNSLIKYTNTVVENHNKKYRKIELPLLKYLSRTVCKTTPFTTLTLTTGTKLIEGSTKVNINTNTNTNTNTNKIHSKSKIEINLTLVLNFFEKLKDSEMKSFFLVKANQTLLKKGDLLHYIKNLINGVPGGIRFQYLEEIEVIKSSNFINIVINKLLEASGTKISYTSLIDKLTKTTNHNRVLIKMTVDLLIKKNVIILYLPYSEQSPNILNSIHDYLLKSDCSQLTPIIKSLKEIIGLIENLNSFSIDEPEKKLELIEEIKYILLNLYDLYSLDFPETNTIVYEDAAVNSSIDYIELSKADINEFTSDLNIIQQILPLYDSSNISMLNMREFFLRNYPSNEEVKLTEFYSDYSKELNIVSLNQVNEPSNILNKNLYNIQEIDTINKLRERLQQYLIVNVSSTVEEVFEIDENFIKEIGEEVSNLIVQTVDSRSYFLQMMKIKNKSFGVINSIQGGFGHFYSRFLTFPDNALRNLYTKKDNEKFENDSLSLVEITGNFGFNGDLHPPLCNKEFLYGSTEGSLNKDNQVNCEGLFIKYDDNKQRLYVFSKLINKELKFLGNGFLADKFRPAFYNFLLSFNQSSSLTLPDLYLIPQNKITKYPRVVFNRLVVFRKNWMIPIKLIPIHLNSESLFDYHIKLYKFWKENNINDRVFIKYDTKLSQDIIRNNDDGKPQYFCILNPLFIKVFTSLINKTKVYMHLFEMLPSDDNLYLKNFKGDSFISEILIQIDKTE
ncbi:lantibiotic dehydratase [Psychrobacillus sp. FSL H8-0510]|uniref:lantibiotic dehydratase n=1 Tax=Psychrobacillus sp. FSL H8-0510 TaxID=2921394 RepID=UPI0030F74DF1